MKDPVVSGLIVALLAAMAVGLYLFYLPRRRRPTEMEIEHSEFRKKQNELLWAENTELKEQLPKLEDELRMLRSDYSDVNAERERWKKERDEWKQTAERFHDYQMNAIQECNQARSLANDLREYLDRALKIVKEQNEQIRQLTPMEARKHSVRGKDGRFVKRDATPYFVVKEVREVCVDLDNGAVMPAPTPVKHLREVNEEIAKAAEQAKPEQLALLVDTGKLPAGSIMFDPNTVYPIHDSYQRDKGPVGAAKIEVKDGNMLANIERLKPEFFDAFVMEKMGLFIAARVGEDGVTRLIDLSFCVNLENGWPAMAPIEGERPDDSHVGEQAQPADMPPVRDWNVPQAFPEGYVVPEGVRVIKVEENDIWVKKGSIGTTKMSARCPDIEWENEDYDLRGFKCDWAQESYKLAPIDPRQHPEHPEFGKPEQPEPRPDHPCLKGCRKPQGCECPSNVPKDGRVTLVHSRAFFVEKGILPEHHLDWDGEREPVSKWAESIGMTLLARSASDDGNGGIKIIYAFSRPAVNTDFEVAVAGNGGVK